MIYLDTCKNNKTEVSCFRIKFNFKLSSFIKKIFFRRKIDLFFCCWYYFKSVGSFFEVNISGIFHYI